MPPAGTETFLLAVVIVNYKTAQLVTDCLETLLPEVAGLNARVVIVDNASADDSPAIIRKWLETHDQNGKTLLIQSENNGGFAAGNNTGIRAVDAQYYLLLNSDTLVREGSISQLLEAAADYPDAGLVSPRLEWPDATGQESCFRFPDPYSELLRSAKTGLITRILRKHVIAMPVQNEIVRPQWTSFACVLIRAEVFRGTGLLDEGYFMYFEDAEFCYRAGKFGWFVLHDPAARVVHLRGGTSPVKKHTREKQRLPVYYYESRTRFFFQLYGRAGLMAANILWSLGRVVSGSRQLLGRSDKAAIQKEWLDIWKNFFRPLRRFTHPDSR